MSSIIFPTPYTAILSAIWGIIKLTQLAANKLGLRRLISLKSLKSQHYEYITESGTANPLHWLHPERRDEGCGVKHVVMYSSGIGSWAAAKRVVAKHGTKNTILLFADTLIEDEDNYRFLEESAKQLGCQLIRVADGRDPWQVFQDKRWLGNSRVAQCSHLLKQQPCLKWLQENDPEHEAIVYVGIDWMESHRLPAIQKHWQPWQVEAPLTEAPYLDKVQLLEWARGEALKPPRMYDYYFAHANCGGFCVRAGKAHFANLLRYFPDRYLHHEEKEQEFQTFLGKEVTILREQVDTVRQPLSLREFRQRVEVKPTQLNLLDWGGCGCFAAVEEVQE